MKLLYDNYRATRMYRPAAALGLYATAELPATYPSKRVSCMHISHTARVKRVVCVPSNNRFSWRNCEVRGVLCSCQCQCFGRYPSRCLTDRQEVSVTFHAAPLSSKTHRPYAGAANPSCVNFHCGARVPPSAKVFQQPISCHRHPVEPNGLWA